MISQLMKIQQSNPRLSVPSVPEVLASTYWFMSKPVPSFFSFISASIQVCIVFFGRYWLYWMKLVYFIWYLYLSFTFVFLFHFDLLYCFMRNVSCFGTIFDNNQNFMLEFPIDNMTIYCHWEIFFKKIIYTHRQTPHMHIYAKMPVNPKQYAETHWYQYVPI